ncbi:MAG: putative LPS assembly protein LptD [Balneolaceae bacterium]|nr:putative LPS assembly protein LptD [Balneolaceae bacterium]
MGSRNAYGQVEADSLQVSPSDTTSTPIPGNFQPGEQQPPPGLDPGSATQQTAQNRSADRQATEGSVNFQARDSLTFTFGEQRIAMLYGAATVTHESGNLKAGTIELNLDKSQLQATASSAQDTLSHPVLTRDDQELRSTRILFNYETERGKFEVAEMSMADGHLIGTKVKNVSRDEVFIEDGIYSTCPPEHMYYYIQAQRMKVVEEEEIFFTNARLFILDIPYPLVFPFGYVPAGFEQRQSGLLEPTYSFQNTGARGIGLQNLGWFQYFSDYFTAQTSFDVFTSGTIFNETRMQYRKTGNFNGSVTIGYSKERGLEPTDPGFTETTTKRLSVNHSQELSPYASLSANINLRTADYFRRNSFDLDERAETSTTSRVSYRYSHPENTYNFSVSSNLNQQFSTNTTRLTGPEMNFSLRQFSPFKSDNPGMDEQWYERISINYRNNFSSRYTFRPIAADSAQVNWLEALLDPQKYEEATGEDDHLQYGFIQRAQVSAGQLIPSRFLNVSAGINYNEYWYPATIRKEFNEEDNRVETFKEPGFTTTRDFSTNLSFNTTFYGISQIKAGSFEGVRHTVRPNISFSYRPDFSSDQWGIYREVQRDTLGNTQEYSIFEDAIFGGPGAGEQRTMSFGVTNILETKRVRRDSTGEVKSNNLRLIDNLSATSSYNFAADSLNFGRMNVSLSSSAVNNFRIRASAAYSFYTRDQDGREINRFIWQDTNKFLQPLSYSLSVSTDITLGGNQRGARITTPEYRPYDPYDQTFFSPVDTRFFSRPVQGFNSGFRMGLDFSYRWTYRHGQDARKSAVLNANNIQFNLTPKWSFRTRLGYDFIEKELTPSQFSLNRSMVCWNLSFNFNPFGEFQYYSFRLSLSGGQIQGLFQKLPLLNNLERSSSPNGRVPRRY